MKSVWPSLVLVVPLALNALIFRATSDDVAFQRFVFWFFPALGVLASLVFSITRPKGRWFYAAVGVLYGIQLFSSVAFLSWKQT